MANSRVQDLAAPIEFADHVLGPPHAPVTVVEYGDFECPSCKLAAPTVKIMLERYANRVLFAFRHFPLEHAHPHALLAAEAAECAGAQGRFWEMHELLFENQSHLESRHLHGYAERLGLDMARFTAEFEEHFYLQRIREHAAGGRRSHVRATPGFFVDGTVQDVSFGMHSLLDAVDAALARKDAL